MPPDPIVPSVDAPRVAAVPTQVVAEFGPGDFVENLVCREDGSVIGTEHPSGRIWSWHASTGLRTLCMLPVPATGLVFDAAGQLFISGGAPGQATGSIWRFGADAVPELWLEVTGSRFLNGITVSPDGLTLYVVDSLQGRIVAVDTRERRQRDWFQHAELTPRAPDSVFPGANGIKCFGGAVFVSNTDRAQLLKLSLDAQGEPAGLSVVATRLLFDDFAFDTAGRSYGATHAYNSVVRLNPDGTRDELAGFAQGCAGATATAFGRSAADRQALFVTTETALSPEVDGRKPNAKLLRLEVGAAGHPLLGP